MSTVRILVKETHQPPIDTPASIRHHTIDIESEELFNLIGHNDLSYDSRDKDKKHSTFEVIGAEAIWEDKKYD